MPWRDQRIKDVAAQFQVKGVPRLIAIDRKDGKVIENNAVEQITQYGPEAIDDILSRC